MLPKHIRNRWTVLMCIIAAAMLCAVPSLVHDPPPWWSRMLPAEGLRLGLDLQGGMHLILKVDVDRAVQNLLHASVSDLRVELRKSRIDSTAADPADPAHRRLQLGGPGAVDDARRLLAASFPQLELVDRGEGWMELGLRKDEAAATRENAVAQSLEVIRNRVDLFGVEEPVIVRRGSDEIVLQLAGVRDPARALEVVGRTAQLEFKLVDDTPVPELERRVEEAFATGRLTPADDRSAISHALGRLLPRGSELYFEKTVDPQTGAVARVPIVLERQTLMTGDAVKSARVEIGGTYNEPYVGMAFNPRGARLFENLTREHVGRRLAIVLDDVVQSAPVIQEAISGGNAQITGSFTTEEAHDLAIVLRAGALPAPVEIVQNVTVGPTLGQDSIRKGLAATMLGAGLVVAFMTVYYRLSGVIANWALLLNLVLMFGVFSVFRATLTLPGIAGIVLSIGMAVDSNVLIFERMREELAQGKTVHESVRGGYDKAFWTIIDSHVTTLITAAALFLFGTGPIKGFAVTLSAGVVLNLFTALYGTRVVYDHLHFRRRLKTFRFLSLWRNPGIDFIRMRTAAFALSGVLVALGLFASFQIARGRANMGVDFAGGALIQFRAEEAFRLEAVRTALAKSRLPECELQEVPEERLLMVRIKQTGRTAGAAADAVAAALGQHLPGNRFTMESRAEIGATVSRDLQRAALIAVAVSLAGIIAYLGWRFDLRFGVAAAAATFHDVLTVLGVFYLLGNEITLLVVTALLTLAGYSLTDTVVVFDRIRENMGQGRRRDLGEVINRSINEVLARTVITSGTVFMVLLALLLVGGVLLRDFALALLIGVVVGTYSSVFVASPIVYLWAKAGGKRPRAPITAERPRRRPAAGRG